MHLLVVECAVSVSIKTLRELVESSVLCHYCPFVLHHFDVLFDDSVIAVCCICWFLFDFALDLFIPLFGGFGFEQACQACGCIWLLIALKVH